MEGALSLQQQGEPVKDARKALARIQKGEGLRSIGKSLGLSQEGVRKWLLREVGPEYAELQTDGLIQRVVDADTKLEAARDPVDIARAREMARFARMDLERRRPHLYGQRTHVTVEHVDFAEEIRKAKEARARVIEGEASVVSDDAVQKITDQHKPEE